MKTNGTQVGLSSDRTVVIYDTITEISWTEIIGLGDIRNNVEEKNEKLKIEKSEKMKNGLLWWEMNITKRCNSYATPNLTMILLTTTACTASRESWLINTMHHRGRCPLSWYDLMFTYGGHWYYYTGIRGALYIDSDTEWQAPKELRFV